MPELDILHGFKYLVSKIARNHKNIDGQNVPLVGRVVLWPRCWAVGTKQKPWWTSCVVHDMGYTDDLEPVPSGYKAHPEDLKRCVGKKGSMWRSYVVKPLQEGEVCVQSRGKEIILAAGYHAIRCHLGLEGTIVHFKRDQYERIIMNDCPGANSNKSKAEKMRSFIIPSDLTVPEARNKGDDQTIEIFAAIVCERDVFVVTDFSRMVRLDVMSLDRHWSPADLEPGSQLWGCIWDAARGPDWTYEVEAAEAVLDEWRASVMEDPDVTREEPLVEVICANQAVFNGYGRHTAHDLLHHLRIWPGTPPSVICSDDDHYSCFKVMLGKYAQIFVSQEYQYACLGTPNLNSPVAYNYKSDNNYIGLYVKVYRKWSVRLSGYEWNEFYLDGLFDSEHTLGDLYAWEEDYLHAGDGWSNTVVYMHTVGKQKWYSVIRAKRPQEWKYALNASSGVIPEDVRHAGMATTLGPASFHVFKQNQFDPSNEGLGVRLVGRRPKQLTGRRGRPGKRPTVEQVRNLAARSKAARDEAVAALHAMEDAIYDEDWLSDEDSDIIEDAGASMRDLDLPSGRRVTRSMHKSYTP